MRNVEQRFRASSMQVLQTWCDTASAPADRNGLTSFSERYVMTAIKCYEALENVVALAVQNPAVVAGQHLPSGVNKPCKANIE